MPVPASTDVVLLCGGLGTRLRAVLPDGQKTMAPTPRGPFLSVLVRWAAEHGFRRFIFCTGHLGDSVEQHFSTTRDKLDSVYRELGLTFDFSREDSPLGTGGALRQALPMLKSPVVLVLNGDSHCPMDPARLLRFHQERGGAASVVVVESGERRDGGFVKVGAGDRVLSFQEKVPDPSCFLNAGIYAFEREALDSLPPGPSSLERGLLPSLLDRGVFACKASQRLWDIGTPERLAEFRKDWGVGDVR
ncbi:MAG: sugar phosphate nucleotidyltransferase [Elusimicrobiota bacterium]